MAILLRVLKALVRFSCARTEIACARRMWFCGLCNNHMTSMTSFGRVLAVTSASLLCCSFAATGEVIMTAKMLKPMLGNCSVTWQKADNTERMTNDAADFWKLPKSFVEFCDTERCLFSVLRMVSRLAGYPRSIYQSVWRPSCIRHVIQWPHVHDNGVTEPVNGRMKEESRELCKGGNVEVGKMYYSVGWLLTTVSTSRVIMLEVDQHGFLSYRNCWFVWLGRSYWEAIQWNVSIHHVYQMHAVQEA